MASACRFTAAGSAANDLASRASEQAWSHASAADAPAGRNRKQAATKATISPVETIKECVPVTGGRRRRIDFPPERQLEASLRTQNNADRKRTALFPWKHISRCESECLLLTAYIYRVCALYKIFFRRADIAAPLPEKNPARNEPLARLRVWCAGDAAG